MDYKKLVKVADAKAEKRYRITQTHCPMSGEPRKYTMEGTLEELIEAYSYTLEVGHSWESERGNKKINMHPTTIKALCVNLENAKNNAARNGYSGDSFEYEEIGSGVADSKKAVKRSVKKSKIKDSKYMAYSIILNGNEADEMGNGDADEGAKQFVMGYDFSQNDIEEENIAYGEYKDTVEGIDIYYDYGADYYFFCPSKKAVKDSADITKSVEFCIDEDNVYDLIHEGETSVAIPSGADTKAFVAAVEDILKEVASDCGVKGLKIETEIVGNRVNVIKK